MKIEYYYNNMIEMIIDINIKLDSLRINLNKNRQD